MSLVLVLRRKRRASGMEATLVFIASSRPARLHSEPSHRRKKKVDGARIGEEVGRCSSCCSWVTGKARMSGGSTQHNDERSEVI